MAPAAESSARAVIDWTRSEGAVNRPLFSTQGFMQVTVEPDPGVMKTFLLTNPMGTHTRLETYIHQMEPENDDGDPNTFDWNRLHPDKMIRFIDDRAGFEKTLTALGMEPLSLLCYNAQWLKSEDESLPISNPDEWAEFAAAVVESYNGRGDEYRPALRYVEIWNEPNMRSFYTGTRESYFDLFRRTASRIHRDYPGVMVGGPALTHAPECAPKEWMDAFLKECAQEADYISWHHYGPQGEPVSVIMDDLVDRVRRFRQIPGKERGKAMITEIDAWYDGWPKIQYMMERQFRFLDHSDLLLGVHHFCCMAYDESGNYTFGIVDKQGGVVEGTFWPFWIFRNLIGEEAYILRGGTRQGEFDLAASRHTIGSSEIASSVFHNRSKTPIEIDTLVMLPPSGAERVLSIESVTESFKGVRRVKRIPVGMEKLDLTVALEPGEAQALNIYTPGDRHYPFSDMNNQETPWMALSVDKSTAGLGDKIVANVRLLNTTTRPLSGGVALRGVPKEWKAEFVSGESRISGLKFGEEVSFQYAITATTIPEEPEVGFHAVLEGEGIKPGQATSIPVTLKIQPPLSVIALPAPVYTIPGALQTITLQVTSETDKALSGTFTPKPEARIAWGTAPGAFELGPGETKRYDFPLTIADNAAAGRFNAGIDLHFLGTERVFNCPVDVAAVPPRKSVPVDLTSLLNFDAVAFNRNRQDYDKARMGGFVYPGDFTPSSREISIRGVRYRMPSLEDGKKNAILPQGQRIELPKGRYSGVAFIGFGHDGKHPGMWTFVYADGTEADIDSQIPEWCLEPPAGFAEAFAAPHRYMDGGPAPPATNMFTWELAADPAKELVAVKLPSMTNAYLFAITLLP